MLWMLCLPSASLFLLLLPCFPAQDGGGNEKSTDVISAWEGESISITCPMNGSQNQVGMYLRNIRENLNVIYFPKDKPQKVDCNLESRAKCSKEGETLRITLHRLQKSDSQIYLCSEIVEINGIPKELYGKKTIVLVKARSNQAVEQSPFYANPERGQSVSITCVCTNSSQAKKFYLLRAHMQPGQVLAVSKLKVSDVSPDFKNRLKFSREGNRTVVTLEELQEEDSDNYICAEDVMGSPLLSARGTMVLVKGEQVCEKSSWDLYALVGVVVLLFCALLCCTLYRLDVMKYFQKKKPNVVYEDMSYSSRRSTLVRNNNYS